MRPMWLATMLCLGLACQAQTAVPAAPGASAVSARADTAPATNTVPQRGGEPQVRRIVSEDDAVRIDELRVRGITRKVTVQSKLPGAPAYEIGTTTDGGDVAQERRPGGRSLWQLLSF